jgi:uncharacterized protein with HEPN domain
LIRGALGDPALLELIVQLIDHIDRRLAAVEWKTFVTEVDEVDLTAYRLLHIGEAGNKLSEDVRTRNPDFDWRAMYRMRNILAHSYGRMDAMIIWETAQDELAALRTVCAAELARLDQ